jgi:dihydroorotase
LTIGADADVTVLDPDHEWVFDKSASASKSGNSPFDGWRLKGKAVASIVGGNKAWVEQSELLTA